MRVSPSLPSCHLVFLALVACGQDYDLTGKKDDVDGEETGTSTTEETGTDFSDICEGLEGTPHDVALNAECDIGLQEGTFTPVVEYHYGTQSYCGPPGIGQVVDDNGSGGIDADDLPAILLFEGGTNGSASGKVAALRGDNSGKYWTTSRGYGHDGGFSIGDLDNDGWPEVVVGGVDRVSALDGRTGNQVWQSPSLAGSMDTLGYNYPSIADMDGDGWPEVTIGRTILDGQTGTIRGQGRGGWGTAPYGGTGAYGTYGALSVPVDLDGDGVMELVTGTHAYDPDGNVIWSNSGLDGLIAVADFDLDGEGEIVKTSGVYVTGMETDGREVWGPIAYGTATSGTNLGVASVDDLDADGFPDIVFAARNELIAMDWGGTEKWGASISDTSGAAGAVLFDFEGDGYPEVLYADETTVRFFSGLDGSVKLESNQHGSYTILETPVVADVDNDDEVEIVLGHCSWNKSLTVYGDANHSWPPGRKIWNQHGYSITNVDDLGGIPAPNVNWPEFNSFRSGDAGTVPGEYTDVQVEIFDVCEEECGNGKVYVGAWVMNAGNIDLPAGIPVSIHAGASGPALATSYTTAAIPSGRTGEALLFEVDADAMAGEVPVAKGDLDGSGVGVVYECDEGNNVYDWSAGVCD